MKSKSTLKLVLSLFFAAILNKSVNAQITLLQDYKNNYSAPIGTFQGIKFKEGGFSGMYPIPNTNGKEFWVISDRGMNVDAANANPLTCRPTYDKMFGLPTYAPKIFRVKLNGDSVQILKTISIRKYKMTKNLLIKRKITLKKRKIFRKKLTILLRRAFLQLRKCFRTIRQWKRV